MGTRWLGGAGAVAAGVWIVAVTGAVQSGGWLIEQYALVERGTPPAWWWTGVGAVNAVLVAVPAVAVRLLARRPGLRAVGTAWLLAAAALALLSPLRALPDAQPALGYAADAAACGLLAALLYQFRRPPRDVVPPTADPRHDGPAPATDAPRPGATDPAPANHEPRPGGRDPDAGTDVARPGETDPVPVSDEPRPGGTGPGIGPGGRVRTGRALAASAAGLVGVLPWLVVGALGDRLETVTALAAAAGFGALAGTVLSGRFWFPLRGRILAGGAAAGVTLVVLCPAVGQGGVQLAVLGAVPVLGFAVAALGGAGRVVGLAVGTAAAGPLALVAPAQASLLLGTRDVGWYALLGTAAALVLAVAVAAGYAVRARRRTGDVVRRNGFRFGAVAVGVAVVAAAAVYPAAGHPGLYGNRLLVVLRTQADLAPAARIANRTARATAVYRELVATARRSQQPLRRALAARGVGARPYYLLDAIEVDSAAPVLRQWLESRPDVDRVLLCPRLRPLPARPEPPRGDQPTPDAPLWNVSLLDADRVVRELGVDGRGITVGGSDTGVDGTHPALRKGFRGGTDSWYDPWYGSRTPVDHNGHGTHTLASAVGRGQGYAQVGVAPGARWVGCVNLGRDMGNAATYLDCLQFMLAPFPAGGDPFRDGDPARGPQVLTNSWDCPPAEGCDADVFAPVMRALAGAGVYVVTAAGNAGPRCGSAGDPPGRYADVLEVGAVDADGRVADFSGRGPVPGAGGKPDVVAPGVRVLSAAPGGGWRYLSGTSMAAPQVAGVVALMWSANPRLVGHVAATTRILTDTATPVPAAPDPSPPWQPSGVPDCGPGTAAGAGLVDAYRAVRAAQRFH